MGTQKDNINNYSIKEASNLTGLPASTLRYYEQIGIIQAIKRGETSGQRIYSQRDIDALDTIACLSNTGMALEDMRTYISNASDTIEHYDDQIRLLENQQDRLSNEEHYLKLRKRYVVLKIDYWKAMQQGDMPKVGSIAIKAKQLGYELKKV